MQLFATLATLAVATVGSVVAAPSSSSSATDSQCNTGPTHCCNSVEPASSSKGQTFLNMLDLVAPTDSHIAMQCTPIDTGSVGGDPSCDAQPVCCNGNSYGDDGLSLFNLGCTPITVKS